MGRSKTSRFRNMSAKPKYTSSSQATQPQQKQPTQANSSMASGITTGLGMEAARAASDAIFTNKEKDKPQIVNAHK
jgi:hypothetical protein